MRHDFAVLEAAMVAQALLVEKLKHQLALLHRAYFGRSSEKLDAEVEQLELLIGDLEETAAEIRAAHPAQTTVAFSAERKPSVRALELIGDLFAIEGNVRGRSPAERRRARVERSVLVLAELKAHLDATLARISGKSPFAAAIRYTTSRWTALTRFTEDARLELSNNAAERAIKPLTLGRKNYLFADSDEGGRRAAILYTLDRNRPPQRRRPASLAR